MHPAISVIFFTVLSGAGFGFMALVGLGWPMPRGPLAAFLICLLAGGLAVIGLVSSTFHLGHPERAWRAFSQWRSSWLSREGVLAVVTLFLFAIYGLVWMTTGHRLALLGYLISLLAITTIYATSMIYASLKTVPSWHNKLTPLCYLAFGLGSGLMLTATFGGGRGYLTYLAPSIATIALMIAWALKAFWWHRALNVGFSETGSDAGTATGLGHLGKVRLFERPHTGENYLTKEMVHKIGRKHARKLRIIAVGFGLVIPFILAACAHITLLHGPFMLLGFISMIAGLFAERWLFFAEAKHAVSLYY